MNLRDLLRKKLINKGPIIRPLGHTRHARHSIVRDTSKCEEILLTEINELKNTKAFLKAILNSSLDQILVLDSNGIVMALNNPANHFSVKNPLISGERETPIKIGTHYLDLCRTAGTATSEGKRDIYLGIKAVLNGELPSFKLEYPSSSLTEKSWFRMSVSPLEYKWGGAVITHTNITELVESRELAKSTCLAKSHFLANMSHEIRNPMNAIIGVAELLSETNLDFDQAQYVEMFKRAGFNLLRLIDDILDISKIESGKFIIEKVEFNLKNTIEEVMEILKNKAESKNLTLSYSLSPNIPECFLGDPYRIKQILMNLIGNSIKFTPFGSVVLSVDNDPGKEKSNLKFKVTDSGIGIAKDQLHKLFQIYSQCNSLSTNSCGGTGLGLSISKKLVEIMGGKIGIDSIEGTGTIVNFTLNCPEIEKSKEKNAVQTKIIKQAIGLKNKIRILLVEDDENNRLLIREYLKNTNYTITEVKNGKTALEAVKKNKYDLIFMDIQMPVMDGYLATAKIRKWETESNLPHIPIVALTACAMKEEQEKCLAAGCTQHLSKPILKKDLMIFLNNII